MPLVSLAPFIAAQGAATGAGIATAGFTLSQVITWGMIGGNFLYQALSEPKAAEGPRLSNYAGRGADYGGFLPIIHGSHRAKEQLIWQDFQIEAGAPYERRITTERDGAKVKLWEYRASWAVAFAQKPVGAIPKIFLGDEKFYDVTSDATWKEFLASKELLIEKSSDYEDQITIYTGNQTAADPTIEAIEGAGKVPPWKDIPYVVFKNISLSYDHSNQIPVASALLVESGKFAAAGWDEVETTGLPDDDQVVNALATGIFGKGGITVFSGGSDSAKYDSDNAIDWTAGKTEVDSGGTFSDAPSRRRTVARYVRAVFAMNNATRGEERWHILSDGTIFVSHSDFSGVSFATGDIGQMKFYNGPGTSMIDMTAIEAGSSLVYHGSNIYFYGGFNESGPLTTFTIWKTTDNVTLFDAAGRLYSRTALFEREAEDAGAGQRPYADLISYNGGLYLIGGNDQDASPNHDAVFAWNAGTSQFTSVTSDLTAEFNDKFVGLGDSYCQVLKTLNWQPWQDDTERVIAVVRDSLNERFILLQSTDPANDTDWRPFHDYSAAITGISSGDKQFIVSGDQRLSFNIPGKIFIYDSVNNDAEFTVTAVSYDSAADETTFTVLEAVSNNVASGTIYHYPFPDDLSATGFDRDNRPAITTFADEIFIIGGDTFKVRKTKTALRVRESSAGDVVRYIAQEVGRDNSAIETSDIDDIAIPGHAIEQQTSGKDLLLPLQRAYFFDFVSYDDKDRFVKRGGTAIAIPETELGWKHETNPDGTPDASDFNKMSGDRTPRLELPKQIDVIYYDINRDYNQSTQSASRGSADSRLIKSVRLPVAMSAAQARKVADVLLWDAYAEANRVEFTLSDRYAYLTPTDVISTSVEGVDFQIRITRIMTDDGLLTCQGVAEAVDVYDRTPPVLDDASGPTSHLYKSGTFAVLMDLPLLRRIEAGDDYGFELAVARSDREQTWQGAALVRVNDGGDEEIMAEISRESTMGSARTALAAPASTAFFDTVNTVDVLVSVGSISSITQDALFKGGNQAVIGDEILGFQTVTALGNNKFRLSNLLRGLFGTEWAVDEHTANERFVVLGNTTRVPLGSADIGVSYNYKIKTIGGKASRTLTFTGEGVTKMPYSPVQVTGRRLTEPKIVAGHVMEAGTWRIEWMRRTRGLYDVLDEVPLPLNEDAEVYEIDFWSGGAVVHTVEVKFVDLDPDVKPYFYFPVNGFWYTNHEGDRVYRWGQSDAEVFGAAVTELTIDIYQTSAQVGRGFPASAVLTA